MTLRVVLVGLPGVGKTTVGAALAQELGVAFVDLDDAVSSRCGEPPAALLRSRGEPAFRVLETDALGAVLARDEGMVLATGGGTVESEAARALLVAEPLVVAARRAGRPRCSSAWAARTGRCSRTRRPRRWPPSSRDAVRGTPRSPTRRSTRPGRWTHVVDAVARLAVRA